MTDNNIKWPAPSDVTRSIIMVVGVGGAGGNALNHMIDLGINDVTFMACNTDAQALDQSKATIRIQLGSGLGAGNKPERGSQAAKESLESIKNVFESEGIKMLFLTAGMGGGTGTGASPIIAKAAQELDILTVAIVTTPFTSEGPTRVNQAREGIKELREYTDSLLVLSNDSITSLYGDLPLHDSFAKADDVLASSVKGIAEIITGHGRTNVDFADVNTVMRNSGCAFMGSAKAGGPQRAEEAVKEAVTSLLLNYRDIRGAKELLLNISSGNRPVTMNEVNYVLDYLQECTGGRTNIIWGEARKPSLEDELELTVVATGFSGKEIEEFQVPPPVVEKPSVVDSFSTSNTKTESGGGFIPPSKRTDYERYTPKGNGSPVEPPKSVEIEWKGVDRYANLNQIVSTPAWIRNHAELSKVRPRAKVVLNCEGTPKPEAPKGQPASLFDTP
jgi:cell division protein FtsZ